MVASRPFSIAIAGGGIAGLASAIFLARDGHRVELFEKMPGITAEGTGILLQPAGIDVLRRLGLADAAFAVGAAIQSVVTRARSGDSLMNLRYADLQPNLRALGIQRPALARVLFDAARSAGAVIHFGSAIAAVREKVEQISLVERGESKTHGPFDVALICDGSASRLRDSVAPGAKVRVHAHGVYSVVAPRPPGVSGDALLQRLNGMRDGVGLLPIGQPAGATPLVSFFWNARAIDLPRLEAAGYSSWCTYIEGFCPEAAEFLRTFKGFDSLTWSSTAEVTLRRWHSARSVVIGDAAHALNPQLGLGATMALLDAECASEALRGVAGDIPAALAAYQLQRRARIERYARVSRIWSSLDASGFSPLRRRLFLSLANTYPALRRRMLQHVCGYA